MEKTCKWCNETINFIKPKSFGAHLTNCKMNPNKIERDFKSVKRKDFNLICSCGVEYVVNITNHHYSIGRYNKFCSRKCANSKPHTDESKTKISKSLSTGITYYFKLCRGCNNEFKTRLKRQISCSRSCNMKYRNGEDVLLSRSAGKKSVKSQGRRSKNEILFSEYCENKFIKVLSNEPIFNGWDADVIIEDIKVAVLWNGIWHYKKMMIDHDLDKVNEREKRKLIEIEKCGYTPYIIKDMGAFSEEKVKTEWEIFNIWLENKKVVVI